LKATDVSGILTTALALLQVAVKRLEQSEELAQAYGTSTKEQLFNEVVKTNLSIKTSSPQS